jgi:hypothetical protein
MRSVVTGKNNINSSELLNASFTLIALMKMNAFSSMRIMKVRICPVEAVIFVKMERNVLINLALSVNPIT